MKSKLFQKAVLIFVTTLFASGVAHSANYIVNVVPAAITDAMAVKAVQVSFSEKAKAAGTEVYLVEIRESLEARQKRAEEDLTRAKILAENVKTRGASVHVTSLQKGLDQVNSEIAIHPRGKILVTYRLDSYTSVGEVSSVDRAAATIANALIAAINTHRYDKSKIDASAIVLRPLKGLRHGVVNIYFGTGVVR